MNKSSAPKLDATRPYRRRFDAKSLPSPRWQVAEAEAGGPLVSQNEANRFPGPFEQSFVFVARTAAARSVGSVSEFIERTLADAGNAER
jgi:hypothetical protein